MEFASEMVIKAAKNGLKISEMPIPYYPSRRDRIPHLHTFRDGWRHLRFMLVFCPKYLFLLPGLILFLGGAGLSAALMLKPVVLFGVPLGLSAGMFAGALMFIGLQVALLGVLGATFHSSAGLWKPDRLNRFLQRYFTLEKGLALGAATFALGVALGVITIVLLRRTVGVSPNVDISVTRMSTISIFIALLGMQLVFFSFSLSLFDLNKTLEHDSGTEGHTSPKGRQ